MRPSKRSRALELRRVALVVAVVAAAHVEEAARQHDGLARVRALRLDRPARLVRRPLGAHDPVVEADVLVDALLARGVADVARGSTARRRSPSGPSTGGAGSRACACRSPTGCRDSGTGPTSRRCRRGPRGSRSSCRGTRPGGGGRRRCRTGRRRRSGRRGVRASSRSGTVLARTRLGKGVPAAQRCSSTSDWARASVPGSAPTSASLHRSPSAATTERSTVSARRDATTSSAAPAVRGSHASSSAA